ncbi:hypothetical protein [Streptomyces sp. cg35]
MTTASTSRDAGGRQGFRRAIGEAPGAEFARALADGRLAYGGFTL